MRPTKMEVNAAIEGLLSSEGDPSDLSAAGPLAEFARSLELSGKLVFESSSSGSKQTSTFTGHTHEAGNVSYSSSEDKEKEYSYGRRKERVGYYKVWVHGSKKRGYDIYVQHFWKSDIDTVGPGGLPPQYLLHCDADFRSEWFGVAQEKVCFQWKLFGYTVRILRRIMFVLKGDRTGREMPVGISFRLQR